jgi:hypothetical protein
LLLHLELLLQQTDHLLVKAILPLCASSSCKLSLLCLRMLPFKLLL